ncbi:cysteine desulfurase family protein [Selenomonas sp. CM52]|uniref:cysteine desulfurase family protein n=1 Tax=Selenomonas sp. CM52 TaxID=936381 RepID=UPI00027C6866|nr:cysteine desulfurase family protein [Selenomonas sp. CM52]EJU29875.1 putative cysteine desulfurase [Selenomonas sp. CM52]
MSIYLDWNASAPIAPEVVETMMEVYRNQIGNADSRTHAYGEAVRAVVEHARKQVAALLGVTSAEVFFTSGATESSNIAIQGLAAYAEQSGKRHIITSAIEHKAVLETVKAMGRRGFVVDIVAPEPSGRVAKKKIMEKLRADTLLVSLMHVNNETGVIQPVEELGAELEKREILFHVDATQSCGKLVDELRRLKYRMLSFSAHKMRGPQGVGVLVLKKRDYKLPPVKAILYGGEQERGIRPGTIPAALAAGCGKACELAAMRYKEDSRKLQQIKAMLLQMIDEAGLAYSVNGDAEFSLPSTLNLSLHGVSAEALMIAARDDCAISNGSACTSKSYAPSYVLAAMGVPAEQIESSIRLSWGAETDMKQLKTDFAKLLTAAKRLA